LFGSAGPANFLNKITTVAAIVFMITSFTLTIMSSRGGSTSSKVLSAPQTQQEPPSKTVTPAAVPAENQVTPTPAAEQKSSAETKPAETKPIEQSSPAKTETPTAPQ
jgi:preprotein translocase subunit SecG